MIYFDDSQKFGGSMAQFPKWRTAQLNFQERCNEIARNVLFGRWHVIGIDVLWPITGKNIRIFCCCFSFRISLIFTLELTVNSFVFLFRMKVVRKLALVTLTGYMERYCPTHRSGWNWELPKFIKKIKAPDYKGKLLPSHLNRLILINKCL